MEVLVRGSRFDSCGGSFVGGGGDGGRVRVLDSM